MRTRARRVFPLVPRRRLVGVPFGEQRTPRRGHGSDVAGSRPYERGDAVSTIDWPASARLSAAHGIDEFIVHTRFRDESPRVAVVCDRRPAMALYEPPFPWLSKRDALAAAARMIADSALAARAEVGYLDLGSGRPHWLPPGSRGQLGLLERRRREIDAFDAPEDNIDRALEFLARRRRDLPTGTFVFVLSDFVVRPSRAALAHALAARWDLVPVVIQDPTWEQSFGDIAGVVVPVFDPARADVVAVRMTRREARERRRANEERLRDLLALFARSGLDPVVLGTSEPPMILAAFLAWAERRRLARRARR
jgi:uncharacterized protein (DUF58 family)